MKGWLPFLGALAGFVAGYFLFAEWKVLGVYAGAYASYLSLATLAALDTVLGGVRASIEGRFQNDVFFSGFILNTILAAGLAALGDVIGVNLFLAVVVALGTRLFLNLSLIRRYYLTNVALKRRQERDA